jgi:hypothetical protein
MEVPTADTQTPVASEPPKEAPSPARNWTRRNPAYEQELNGYTQEEQIPPRRRQEGDTEHE